MFTWKPWMASVLVFIQLVILAQHGQNSSDIVSFPYFSLLFFFFFSHCHPKHKCWGSSSVWSPSSVNSSIVSGPWHVLLHKIYKLSSLSICTTYIQAFITLHFNCRKPLSSDSDKYNIALSKISQKHPFFLNSHTRHITHLFAFLH